MQPNFMRRPSVALKIMTFMMNIVSTIDKLTPGEKRKKNNQKEKKCFSTRFSGSDLKRGQHVHQYSRRNY